MSAPTGRGGGVDRLACSALTFHRVEISAELSPELMVVRHGATRYGTVGAANPASSLFIDTGEIRMNETMIAMSGVVVTDLKKGEARGTSVVSFRLMSTVRRWERGKGWYDADHNFVTVTCWRGLADNVSSSVKRGDPLMVAGRMRVRSWDTADREGSTVEIEATSVGHDLSRGTSAFRKHKDAEPERTEGDEQLKQVRWHVEEQSRSAERAVLEARRSGASVPSDLTALALGGGASAALAPTEDVGAHRNGQSPGIGSAHGDAATANREPVKRAAAPRSKDRVSTAG